MTGNPVYTVSNMNSADSSVHPRSLINPLSARQYSTVTNNIQ